MFEHCVAWSCFSDLKLVLRGLLSQQRDQDGLNTWRVGEAAELTSLVQTALTRLQNPGDCTTAKKLVCHLSYHHCGLGCLVRHTAYCLITALATGRVLVLSNKPWYYSTVLRQISNTCTHYQGNHTEYQVYDKQYQGNTSQYQCNNTVSR